MGRRTWHSVGRPRMQEVDMFEPSRGILEPRPDERIAGMGAVVPVVVGIGEVMDGKW